MARLTLTTHLAVGREKKREEGMIGREMTNEEMKSESERERER